MTKALDSPEVGSASTHHVVISKPTMISSFTIKAVNEMATMFKNSVSNRINDPVMIAPPFMYMVRLTSYASAKPGLP